LNAAIHEMQQNAETIWCFDPTFEVVGVKSMDRLPIRVGDSVIFSKNDYETGLRNGSLGTVLRVLPVSDAKSPCCFCEFEGAEYQLKTPEVYALTHAYSITVHKSQESQFQ
jgi:exodeoxyribonuclease V alpha subunit